MDRRIALICAAASAALVSSNVNAATIYWQGGGTIAVPLPLLTNNYTDDSTVKNMTPVTGDAIRFGEAGVAVLSASVSLSRLHVGHNLGGGAAQTPPNTNVWNGSGTLTVDNGAVVSLTGGAGGSDSAGLQVGRNNVGLLTIDGVGSAITSNRQIEIGVANNVNNSGTVNVKNGATLTSTLGNINLGVGTGATPDGTQGYLNVSENSTVNLIGDNADLVIGVNNAKSGVTQSGGNINVGDLIEVGSSTSGATNVGSFFKMTGGTTTTGSDGVADRGNVFVGRGASVGATVTLEGGILNVRNRFIMGGGTATGAVTNHSAGTMNVDEDLRIADNFTSATSDATYNLSGTGVINANGTAATVVGRRGKGFFFQSGGDANLGGILAIGRQESVAAATAADGLYEISGGDLTAAGLQIAPEGTGLFRVVGDDGTIDINGNFSSGNTADGIGTLEFKLQAGESLSVIDVSGTATFASGTFLVLDSSIASPTQNVYDLLTATSITTTGLQFTGPENWDFRVVDGGNGKILQAYLVPEPSALGLLAIGGLFGLRRPSRA